MTSQQTPLAYAVAQWLQQSSSSVPADQKAKLQQAAESVSEAFGVDTSSSEQQAKYGSGPGLQAIFDIFLKTQAKMGGGAAPAPAAASSSTSSAPASSAATPSADDLAKAEQLKSEGNKAMSAKDYGAAIEAYGKAIELNPNSPVYFSNRAAAFSQIGQHDQAIDDARQASKIDPKFGKAYSRLGHALFSSGRYQEAVEAYQQGVEVDPTNEVLKKGLAASKEQVSSSSSSSANANPSASRDAVSSPTAGADAGAGAGGFPNFGGGAGGMPDLAAMMNNPMIAQMAQNLMSNPDSLASLMNNPMLRQAAERFGGGGGMPDMSAMMNDPALRDMARNFMGGAGGAGGAGGRGSGGNGNNMYG
ncbi:Tetratricopeptide TPR1 [Kalmanozyma brasiliensis GHG001]|uniref:SGTA homodimerisation domain-containing protein n=1 Tax=Kalmanozyma brasiliensis (strain GHG001) TaxID=1365824 RepID=V5GMI8_KALBG|nr:Tetratricopeptide TPR1 [Kalmanozyma brasiliensis GHG001]EST07177.1 Tetratricopeptide TPR1 [Kalmanozyma brasiliensis GHG001]